MISGLKLRTLVLNPEYLPVSIFPELTSISTRLAMEQYLEDKVDVVLFHELPVLSNNQQIIHPVKGPLQWPSVVVNHNYHTRRKELKANVQHLYYREHAVCFWCDEPVSMAEATKDHVHPASTGGKNTWDNLVMACHDCNQKKKDLPPTGKWKPRKKIYRPSYKEILAIRKKFPLYVEHEEWLEFLPSWESNIFIKHKKKEINLELLEAAE